MTSPKICMVMASIPERFSNLKISVPTLTKQVDEFHLVVNRSLKYPESIWTMGDNISVHASLENGGSASRFFLTDKFDGYYFSVDDDILYPENYVSRMIAELNKHDRAMVCVDGGTFDPYARSNVWSTHKHRLFSRRLKPAKRILLPGMGTSCFLTSEFKIAPEDCFEVNISDISATVKAAKESMPIYAIERENHWLKQLPVHHKALSSNKARYKMMENVITDNKEILKKAYDNIPPSDRS